MNHKPRLLRITTVPISLKLLLEGQFIFFQQQGFEVLTASAPGKEVEEVKQLGVAHRSVSMTRAITPFHDLFSLIHLIRLILKFKPNIIHTHTPKAGLLGMMAAWICRVPIRMHTVAGLPLMEATGLKRWVLLKTEQLTYACATGVYPNSKGLLQFIHSTFNIQDSKFSMIGRGSTNGIDTDYFFRTALVGQKAQDIRSQYHIPQNAVVFSFVGRLVRDKGLVELVDAFKNLKGEARLMLVGSFEEDLDPLPPETMRFLKRDSRVILAGFQNDVRPWMMASDVFVFPSYREGFPNVVMQAACLEIPIIASNINGCNEIIQPNETGILVPAKDSQSLYQAMVTLSNDQSKRNQFAKKSREFVAANFDRQYVWSELLKEYQRLLSSRCGVSLRSK